MHLKGIWKDASLPALQIDQGLLMLSAPTTISKGQTQAWSRPWVINGPSSLWMVIVWPTAVGKKHLLVIETPVGPWSQPIVVSISQTNTAILKGSYWNPLSVLPTTMQSGPEHEYGTSGQVAHLYRP
jgi:hypothetical protein